MLIAARGYAHADAVVFTNGRMLAVEDARWEGEWVTLHLPEGGELTVQSNLVDRFVAFPKIPQEPEPQGKVSVAPISPRLHAVVEHAAEQHRVESSLVLAVIKAESNFDPYAVSRAGAAGLMQLMPGTAHQYGVKDVFNPEQNVSAGARHLASLLNAYDGDLELALAAYNAGQKAVKRYGGVPPFPETRTYVRYVMDLYERFRTSLISAT